MIKKLKPKTRISKKALTMQHNLKLVFFIKLTFTILRQWGVYYEEVRFDVIAINLNNKYLYNINLPNFYSRILVLMIITIQIILPLA